MLARCAVPLPLFLLCSSSLAQAHWVRLYPSTSPAPRVGAALAYDDIRQCTWLLGGETPNGYSNEFWRFDGANWQMVNVPHPSGRLGAGMVFDQARSVVVLFGGYDNNNDLDDTWEWDGSL